MNNREYQKNIGWEEEGPCLYLLYKQKRTKVRVKRSNEGYNHFAYYSVQFNGKEKKRFELREKDLAMAEALSVMWDEVTKNILKNRGENV
jgi:hypothetical protein